MEGKLVMKKRKRTEKIQQLISGFAIMLFMLICGGIGGYVIGKVQKNYIIGADGQMELPEFLFAMFVILVVFYLASFLHICMHETGHLVFGLLTGYQFRSIRFGNIMLVKTESGVKFRKYDLTGTGGQCLMVPPDVPSNSYPTALYNWGGCFANLILSLLCIFLCLFLSKFSVLTLILGAIGLIGIGFALLNGIPISSLSNDGYNAIVLKKDAEARKAFKIQLYINNSLAQGKGIKEMPEEWFEWEEKVPENNFTAAMGVLRFSYLIEQKRFDEAKQLGTFLLENAMSLANVHEILIIAEMFFVEMMLGADKDIIKEQYRKEKKKLSTLKSQPSIQRIFYAYNLLIEQDRKKANECLKVFEKIAKKYPYPSEIEEERELIALVDEKKTSNKFVAAN